MKLHVGSMTSTGNIRESNQDAVVLRSFGRGGKYFVVLAVCDGIGGLEHGELASSLTVQKINDWFEDVLQWLEVETVDPEVLNAHLKDLAEECNRMVRDYRTLHQIDTGTTMSLLLVIREFYYIIQVGDSRVYRYREGQLWQLTWDDSVTRMKDGRVKLYLDNYLGKQEELWFTCCGGELQKQDILLVCSDGLYHFLKTEDLRRLEKDIRKAKKIDRACRQLIDCMLERGERDNITLGLIAVE